MAKLIVLLLMLTGCAERDPWESYNMVGNCESVMSAGGAIEVIC